MVRWAANTFNKTNNGYVSCNLGDEGEGEIGAPLRGNCGDPGPFLAVVHSPLETSRKKSETAALLFVKKN